MYIEEKFQAVQSVQRKHQGIIESLDKRLSKIEAAAPACEPGYRMLQPYKYRLLDVGEVINAEDEFYNIMTARWERVQSLVGQTVCGSCAPFRRKV